ncbi:MAG: tRNA (adenosine(37)-N6)-threonylcarbamoyltransferase complex ATPase subunit type 1 TsaE [Rikenellaceae bacterium]|nr:tRNA (adenosine(37)-N6)-threonylcarbamoyltransferase complex ATPase subunit type 1 TsaE [Rikenellaceae bacterium]
MRKIHIDSEEGLREVAEALLESLDGRTVVAMRGGMGAGKTTLVRALAELMGVEDQVTSPTFALVNEYRAEDGRTLFHFDFYRIDDEREAFDLGYEEYFYSGDLCLVEWPEKIEGLLPDERVELRITVDGESERTFEIE